MTSSNNNNISVPVIHNVVATIQIECDSIDIQRLSQLLPFSSYDKSKFAAITLRLLNPTCTCLLFTSGKLVVTGASSWEQALLTAYHVRDILIETYAGQTFEITAYDVQNIVAHVEIPLEKGEALDLDAFYADHFQECTYQRSMFPGLIYRPLHVSVVLLCFSSARIVITGGKSVEQIFSGWERFGPIVRRYVVRRSGGGCGEERVGPLEPPSVECERAPGAAACGVEVGDGVE
jgi:transcription initiation factor TFIID TATA-box-binding protein